MINNPHFNIAKKEYNATSGNSPIDELFENFPKLIRPKVLSNLLGISVNTIYDWKYRGKTRKIPDQLFIKMCGILYVRKDILKEWMLNRNSPF